jgi:hypothetical protein
MKGGEGTINILYHDTRSVYYEWDYNHNRVQMDMNDFEESFENVPEPKREIKGFIGIVSNKKLIHPYCTSIIYKTKEELLKNCGGFNTIIEINAKEGDGL